MKLLLVFLMLISFFMSRHSYANGVPEEKKSGFVFSEITEKIKKNEDEQVRKNPDETLITYLYGLTINQTFLKNFLETSNLFLFEHLLEKIANLRKKSNNKDLYNDLLIKMKEILESPSEGEQISDQDEKLTALMLYINKSTIVKNKLELLPSNIITNTKLIKKSKKIDPKGLFIQFNTIDQFSKKIAEFGDATCPVQAVRNAAILLSGIFDHAKLKELTNVEHAVEVLKKAQGSCKSIQWATTEGVQDIVDNNIVMLKPSNITIIDNVGLLENPDFMIEKTKNQLEELQKKFKTNTFYHAFIMGTGESASLSGQGLMHWFAVVIIKIGNNVQCLIADTSPERDHLDGDVNEKRLLTLLNYFFGD